MKTTILVIEDTVSILENISEILELAGFKAIPASNGKEGIINAQKHLPDLILCDILMPKKNGYEVLTELSQMIKQKNIPFIFLSAKSEKNDLKWAMELGADGYLTKPFDSDELIELIRSKLNKR
ncbi:MAG: response regulator [Bacteroidetes bacterium]|nr:response regulator [Bacteroidota bacterium]